MLAAKGSSGLPDQLMKVFENVIEDVKATVRGVLGKTVPLVEQFR